MIAENNPDNAELVRTVRDLSSRLRTAEDELFWLKLLHSGNVKSGIPTLHADARHGGAVIVTNQTEVLIISVSLESNQCRDVFITRLADATHGTTEKKENLIPFNNGYRQPMYDGDRYVYFTETTLEAGKGRRFGRLDVVKFTFEELSPLPEGYKTFCYGFAGCCHFGAVYIPNADSQLCVYDVERNTWFQHGMTIPTEGQGWGRFLSDPRDRSHLYCIGRCTMSNLYLIDLERRQHSILCPLPTQVNELDAALVRPSPESDVFVIVARMYDGTWYVFSSKTNTWNLLPSWKKYDNNWIRNFLVYSPASKTFYYHEHGSSTWDIVQL